MAVWIGIDGGGTKTSCVLGDETGRILSSITGPSTNIQGNDTEVVLDVINHLVNSVIETASCKLEDVQTIQMCLAGVDRPDDRAYLLQILRSTSYYEKVVLTNDAEAALAAGTWGESGFLLIAGTGSILYRVADNKQHNFRIGGWGYLFGDEGSGFAIGRHAIQAVLQAYDGREKPTKLTEALLSHYEMQNVLELIQLYRQHPIVTKIASCSKNVIEVAEQGDEVAHQIVQSAVVELVRLIKAAQQKMAIDGEMLVLHGGLFESKFFKAQFTNALTQKGIHLQFISAQVPAVVGAYILAMINNQVNITSNVKRKVIATYNDVVKGE